MKSLLPPLKSIFSVLFIGLFFLYAFPGKVSAQIVINEYSASNLNDYLDNYNKYEDWVELYNAGGSYVDLSGFFLSDKINKPAKWQFPNGVGINSGEHLVIWTSGRDELSGNDIHTNFKLSQTKNNPEYIVLSDPDTLLLEAMMLELTQLGHSRGRTMSGGQNWGLFKTPTPYSLNENSIAYMEYTARPTMNDTAGFYTSPRSIVLSTTEPNGEIRYTTDGSEPTINSPLYTVPISISFTAVVKARSFSPDPGLLPGLIEFNTFFINESHNLPVISVSANELQNLLNGDNTLYPHGTCEYFNTDGVRTTQGRGEFNSHGQDSWVHDQRSFDFIMRDEMAYDNELHDKLYPGSKRKNFQRIILRASGDDNYPGIDSSTHGRDLFVHTLAQKCDMALDVRKAARCIVYIDGKYWGVYALREKVDDHDYTGYYYDQGKYDLQFLMTWGWTWTEYGEPDAMPDWLTLYQYILDNDMSDPVHYNYVASQYDIKSLTDYVLINSWVVCSDWLNWNTAWWRGLDPAGTHQKWGYILWDEDATFGHYINYTQIPSQTPDVDPCFPEGLANSYSDPEGHITLLNRLLNNAEFEQYYISRYADLLNKGFSCDSMHALLDSLVSVIQPEMSRHVSRWGGSVNEWEDNVQQLKDFIDARCSFVPVGLADCYSLDGPYRLAVNIDPPQAGKIQLNSLSLETFPWSGDYYDGIDVLMEAVADSGYVFDHWELVNHSVLPDDTTKSVALNINGTDSVVAVFRQDIFVSAPQFVLPQVKIEVLPNPIKTHGQIKVHSDKLASTLIVFDLNGREVMNTRPESNNLFRINREELSDGMYVFKVFAEGDQLLGSGKIIVE